MESLIRQKNKTPAAIQITAEQLIRESKERQDKPKPAPKQRIADLEELLDYQLNKRSEFENAVRRNRTAVGAWMKYAQWEAGQDEMERARSVFERALEHEHRNPTLWMKYTEMELKAKNVNRARNLYDRVTATLPRVDVFWYKYTYMEELVGNASGARQVFERWMEWEPTEEAWMAFAKFEMRYKEVPRARDIYKRFVTCFPAPKNWIKWSKFEETQNDVPMARKIYEECFETLQSLDQNMYISFAKFETRHKEIDRARAVYKFAIEKLPSGMKENLHHSYTLFEKQFGSLEGLEDVVFSKRRLIYEEELLQNPLNYDTWLDYIRLEEASSAPAKIRQVYERAIANTPLVAEKKYWRRYIYLWIYYAIWEELEGDLTRAKQVYMACLDVIPHRSFTFAKIWTFYARFLIRQGDLTGARKTFGKALGVAPKEKIYKEYIALEVSLCDFERVRTLYTHYLTFSPINTQAWIRACEVERGLGDLERCRGMYEIAVVQEELDMPEVLWKSYLDFETEEGEWVKARNVYLRLLERTTHVKVLIAFAMFEGVALDHDSEGRVEAARARFESSNGILKDSKRAGDRVVLLEAWSLFETEFGDVAGLESVRARMPKAVKRRRKVVEGGVGTGWEEYFDYVFPEDGDEEANVRLLKMAHEWKVNALNASGSGSDSEDDE